jgi:hypothetical protein
VRVKVGDIGEREEPLDEGRASRPSTMSASIMRPRASNARIASNLS